MRWRRRLAESDPVRFTRHLVQFVLNLRYARRRHESPFQGTRLVIAGPSGHGVGMADALSFTRHLVEYIHALRANRRAS
jgi:hypothetical protein